MVAFLSSSSPYRVQTNFIITKKKYLYCLRLKQTRNILFEREQHLSVVISIFLPAEAGHRSIELIVSFLPKYDKPYVLSREAVRRLADDTFSRKTNCSDDRSAQNELSECLFGVQANSKYVISHMDDIFL